mmetsp:Transcript_26056/g.104268  ORF Transcript_26056/g.104268 Transcript_26056/m.104268 type:complete len:234 (-) Transcript_26056:875-1576(-)
MGRSMGSQPSCLMVRRICAGVGWAVHGLVLEFVDGSRGGVMFENDGSPALLDDASLARRGNGWTDVAPGDVVTRIEGRLLAPRTPQYFCHAVSLTFRSGRVVAYEGEQPAWRGDAFGPFVLDRPDAPSLFVHVAMRRRLVRRSAFPGHRSKPAEPVFIAVRSALGVAWSRRVHRWLPAAATDAVIHGLLVARAKAAVLRAPPDLLGALWLDEVLPWLAGADLLGPAGTAGRRD